MTNEEILEKYFSEDCDSIYGYMYGEPYINVSVGNSKIEKRPDDIVKIKKSSLRLGKDQDCFIFVWGWPGPDANIYEFSDYGRTWAYSEEEIIC